MSTSNRQLLSGVKVDRTSNGHLIVRVKSTHEEFWVEWPRSLADGSPNNFQRPADNETVIFELIDGQTQISLGGSKGPR